MCNYFAHGAIFQRFVFVVNFAFFLRLFQHVKQLNLEQIEMLLKGVTFFKGHEIEPTKEVPPDKAAAPKAPNTPAVIQAIN